MTTAVVAYRPGSRRPWVAGFRTEDGTYLASRSYRTASAMRVALRQWAARVGGLAVTPEGSN